jgi:hypothetical protein
MAKAAESSVLTADCNFVCFFLSWSICNRTQEAAAKAIHRSLVTLAPDLLESSCYALPHEIYYPSLLLPPAMRKRVREEFTIFESALITYGLRIRRFSVEIPKSKADRKQEIVDECMRTLTEELCPLVVKSFLWISGDFLYRRPDIYYCAEHDGLVNACRLKQKG